MDKGIAPPPTTPKSRTDDLMEEDKSPDAPPPHRKDDPQTPTTPNKSTRKQDPPTPTTPKSPRKHRVHYEPVEAKLHSIRKFAYVVQQSDQASRLKRPPKDKQASSDDDTDPWGDFSDYEDEDTTTLEEEGIQPSCYDKTTVRYPIRVQSDQWAHLAANPKCWLDGDHISFYTWWSQRETSPYDETSCYFPITFPAGQQAAIYSWFQQDPGISEAPLDVMRLIQYIWRVVHPPSYFLAIESQYSGEDYRPEEMDRWY